MARRKRYVTAIAPAPWSAKAANDAMDKVIAAARKLKKRVL